MLKELDSNYSTNLKMCYVYLHIVFDEFIHDTIKALFFADKDLLADSERKLDFSDIIACSNYDEVFEKMVDRYSDSLGHQSYSQKIKILLDRGIHFTIDRDVWNDDIILFYEIRNSITHSGLKINEISVNKLLKTKYRDMFSIGDYFLLSESQLRMWVDKLTVTSENLYNNITAKYPLLLS